nr:f-box protein [Quercus suber]
MLIGSANGLFCLYEQQRYILWNPSIRKFITLPKRFITVKAHGLYIGCCRQAFGFDSRTNDYKVVRISFPSRINMSEEAKPPLIEPSSFFKWCCHFAAEYAYKPSGPLVLSFDLHDEAFHVIPLPNVTFKWTNNVHTSVIGGLLSLLFHYVRNADNKCCAIWVMKEYGVVDSWTKQFTVDLNGGGEIIRVLGLQKNGNILVEAILSGPSRCELSSYDPKSELVKNLGICGRSYYFHVDNYMENLGLLDKPNETVSKRRVSRKRICRGQSGDMFSGAGDQSVTQVQQGSLSAN